LSAGIEVFWVKFVLDRKGINRWISFLGGILLRRRCKSHVGWLSVFWGFLAMEKSFIVESKSFVFSVLEGASVLRVVERRKDFLGEVILSTHCAV
jgi:hypothetical protein